MWQHLAQTDSKDFKRLFSAVFLGAVSQGADRDSGDVGGPACAVADRSGNHNDNTVNTQ